MRRYRIDPPSRVPETTKPTADWTAWVMHLLLGLSIGGTGGAYFSVRLMVSKILADDHFFLLVVGPALFVAGITSLHGEQAWHPRSRFDMAIPAQSSASRGASWVIGIAGIALAVAGVLLDSGHPSGSLSSGGSSGPNQYRVWLALLFAVFSGYSLWSGCLLTPRGILLRSEEPLLYWFGVVSAIIATAIFAGVWPV